MKPERLAEMLSTWPTRSGPLHLKLSGAIEAAIKEGALLPGVRLPAERALAHALSLSRTTIVTAYGHLRERGWLESKTGSGTWVSRRHASGARSHAHASVVSRGSLLNLLQTNDPSLIDLAMATTEPLAELVEAALGRAHEEITNLVRQRNYMPFGLHALRKAVAEYYTKNGTPTSPDQVLITTGAQQAISLITSLFVHRGDPVLVENPTYFGALEAFRFAGARISPVPMTKEHVQPEVLSRKIAAVNPRLIYLAPTCQNPTGAIMPTFARHQIARDAEDHGVPIIEDDTLADLVLRGSKPPSIASYSASAPILTIGSLSKLICPAIRIGWIRGPISIVNRLAKVKSATDLGSSLITQAVAHELFPLIANARAVRATELREKRDLVLKIVREKAPDWTCDDPSGGMSLWLRLPETDTHQLAQLALRHAVTIAPGNLFSCDESHAEFVRLPFLLPPESLAEGVERLIDAWKELTGSCTQQVEECVMV